MMRNTSAGSGGKGDEPEACGECKRCVDSGDLGGVSCSSVHFEVGTFGEDLVEVDAGGVGGNEAASILFNDAAGRHNRVSESLVNGRVLEDRLMQRDRRLKETRARHLQTSDLSHHTASAPRLGQPRTNRRSGAHRPSANRLAPEDTKAMTDLMSVMSLQLIQSMYPCAPTLIAF